MRLDVNYTKETLAYEIIDGKVTVFAESISALYEI